MFDLLEFFYLVLNFFEVSMSSGQVSRIQEIINNLRKENNELKQQQEQYNNNLDDILTKLQITFDKNITIEKKFELLKNFCVDIGTISF
jgi:hypothetical protein